MKKLSIVLALVICLATFSVPTATAADIPIEDTSRIVSDALFNDIEPTSVQTTYIDGRIITVTTYTLGDGEVITDTFERSGMTAYSYEGSDTATSVLT